MTNLEKMNAIRDLIPVTQNAAYFNTGSVGAMSTIVIDALHAANQRELLEGRATMASFNASKQVAAEVRQRFANLVNADQDNIALTHHTTDGMNIAIYGLNWQPGDEVVTTDLELVPSPRHRDPTVLDFCARCSKCADACPSDAISTGPREAIDGVPRWQIDSEACFTLWCVTGTDCARCMRACPYSHPDNWLHNLVRAGVRRSPRFRRLAIRGDDWLYGRLPTPKPLPDWMG